MITLDPDMVGNLEPVSKLTTTLSTTSSLAAPGKDKSKSKPQPAQRTEIPFARLPRIDRLRMSGKIDDSEDRGSAQDEGDGGEEGDEETKKKNREEREKRKMRGKGKSMKRYLRKQRKNVVDPAAIAIRAKLEKQREEKKRAVAEAAAGRTGEGKKASALDRFKRSK
ncbi:hypothetical protein GALMADRAFT_395963 [Galerina marginata CBS 339.88]|uniref:Uncharacterized protein n=1 Tax=Galerina marginata (strain CBS 339.88) TaxID=685588 RepID=A0A067TUG8_GALM3|nr:hypothetical protein GALMADRAFT_395963 [Galerina marginata CBS 339.88]